MSMYVFDAKTATGICFRTFVFCLVVFSALAPAQPVSLARSSGHFIVQFDTLQSSHVIS